MAKQELRHGPSYYYTELIARIIAELKEKIRSFGGGELVEFWATTHDEIFEAMKDLTPDDIGGMYHHMPPEATQSVTTLLSSLSYSKQIDQETKMRGLVARLLAVLVYAKLQEEGGDNKATALGMQIPDLGATTALGMPVLPAAEGDAVQAVEPSFVIQAGVPTEEADPPSPAVTAQSTGATSELAATGDASPVADAPRHPPGQGQQPAQVHPRQITGDRAYWPPPPAPAGPITTAVEQLNGLPAGATRLQKLWASRRVITLALIILMPSLLIAAVIIMMSYYKR
jgi:hypothetical protein